ncbi:MAG: hypothetical protein ACF8QF_08935 [Phycisphaerales bacterium]
MDIPTHKDWIARTKVTLRKRSPQLEAIDEAILAYEKAPSAANKKAIKRAFARWRFEKSLAGDDWRKSIRNQKRAVTDLARALQDIDGRRLSQLEREAMEWVAVQQARELETIFSVHNTLQWKPSTLMGMLTTAQSSWQQFRNGAPMAIDAAKQAKSGYKTAKSIHTGVDRIRDMGKAASNAKVGGDMVTKYNKLRELIKEMCPGVEPNKVFTALGLGHPEQFIKDIAPFVGAISSGFAATKAWIDVARAAYRKHASEAAGWTIAAGDPEAALQALIEMIARERNSLARQAGVKTGAFGGKLAGGFLDAGVVSGPVVGALETLAMTLNTIYEYVCDHREMQAAKIPLEAKAYDFRLFEYCPLLGCYFLVVVDHSTIINFAVGEWGTDNWMFDVERMMKKIEPLLEQSQKYIHASRLEVPSLRNYKGVVQEGYSVKTGLAKVAATPGHVVDVIAERVDNWVEKPVKPKKPIVDKSRIYGVYGVGGEHGMVSMGVKPAAS